MMLVAMGMLFVCHSLTALYIGIGLIGFGNSNVFSVIFSQALMSSPSEKNEVSGLMIMGLFGGTVFPPRNGLCRRCHRPGRCRGRDDRRSHISHVLYNENQNHKIILKIS